MAEKKKLIFLIEDEQTLANLIQLRLEKAGYRVETEKNGKIALALIPKLKPDLILLDLMLPGLGGFDIMEARFLMLPGFRPICTSKRRFSRNYLKVY